MDAGVVVELGMEREADLVAVANGHDVPVAARHDCDVISGFGDVRCPDEREGDVAHVAEISLGMEAGTLTAVGVAPNRDGESSKPLDFASRRGCVFGEMRRALVSFDSFGEKDKACARREHRHAAQDPSAQCFGHP